ncbi:MAG: transposase family protein [Bacteroides sp.]|nr:transposase family protein [Bacteroidales bacterium]MBD5250900.1 transposase family protein [Barnesiella sp.]MBD5253235.1 transposase family protein [Barnesiella sp.]MBD5343716.1 transposase family protein [Bacteroides sp.]MBD5367894.1 transposase family protein [Bacteroides sp.]
MHIEISVKDPRVLGKVKHELEDVLSIALIGVLCSCDDYDEKYPT